MMMQQVTTPYQTRDHSLQCSLLYTDHSASQYGHHHRTNPRSNNPCRPSTDTSSPTNAVTPTIQPFDAQHRSLYPLMTMNAYWTFGAAHTLTLYLLIFV